MKKLLVSDDKTVVKIVHDDASETAIKTVSSCDTCMTEDGEFELNETDRNKYSIFISDSAGCYMKCQFCYLTLKEMKYAKIGGLELFNNLIEALEERIYAQIDHSLPKIQPKYVKLCWMGMGDAFIKTDKVAAVTRSSMDYIMQRKLALGLDGVDLSTVMPKVKDVDTTLENLQHLEHVLEDYPLNPHNDILVHRNKEFSNTETTYPARSRFRLFYSLHSAIQESRDKLIPNAMPLDEAIPALLRYSENNKHNVIFHHMFMDGFNDTEEEIDALIELIELYDLQNYELRILRYNTCEVSTYIHESDNFKNIIRRLMDVHPHIKVQISAGSEVKAACGQFLVTKTVDM
jgi:adenine C2-methylase RlmN of 23S rRNA A2503 and tRNA A37